MKIILEKSKCIGCGNCVALCEKFFELGGDGKCHLKGSELDPKTQRETLEVDNSECAKDAAETCPVQAISIE